MRQIFAKREWDKYSLLRLNASIYSVIGRNEGRSLIFQCQQSGKFECELAKKGAQKGKKGLKLVGYSADKTCFRAFQKPNCKTLRADFWRRMVYLQFKTKTKKIERK